MAVKNLITLGIGAAPGSVAPLILLGLGVNPGTPSPGTLLDAAHFWQLEIAGTDRYRAVEDGAITWSEYEGGEIGTLRATLKETGTALGIVEWQEVVLKDGSTPVWGGYITAATPLADRLGNVNRLTWTITCQSYAVLLNRTRRIRKIYYGDAPGDILADLFDQALDPEGTPPTQVEFDTSTYVTTGSWLNDFTFATDGEKFTDILDRLAMAAGYVWWIDAGKAVHFGPGSSSPADFGIKLAAAADYVSYFPPNADAVTAKVDATDIRNRITVHGGVKVSNTQTETYTGDGVQLVYPVTYHPIVEIVRISVGGVIQSFGTDWYHSFDDYDCLVNYSHGTVRWDSGNAPPNGDSVIISYRFGQEIVVTRENVASIVYYNRTFEYEIVDRTISSAATATAIADAMLAEYAYGLVAGSFDVNRLGIKAGQLVEIVYPALSLDGDYQVRQVNGIIRRGGLVTMTVHFGGRRRLLGSVLQGNAGGGPVVPSGKPGDTPILAGGRSGASVAKDQYGQQFTVPDYGAIEKNTSSGGAIENYHIRFRNADDDILHTIEGWSDQTSLGANREVFNLNGTTLTKYGYLLLQMIAKKEAYTRLGATGGYGEAGQQTASIHIYAYRKDGLWDHSRVYLDADTVRVKTYTGGAEPDPGTDSLPDGLLVYTDGKWDPGSGEGLYIRINAAWRPLAVVENARQYLDNSIDLEGNHLYNVGNLDLEPGGTQTTSFNAGATSWYAVNTGSGNITATLPQLSTVEPGRVYIFVKVTADGNQMIVDGYSSETINGATTQSTSTQWGVIRVIARNTDWLMW